ncbi:hypothetical protein ULVI_02800 [Cochleicola gelatinilyticus]|uniref:Secretion system C-terminal sorting domain-containing protein n=2 Tax=Cochleicola gelatinilyticus TaxID=1763537 RepID=A0A167IIQ9_9FLAO|nr:hypothetical protein ULVI_02800 [Cochleicola gelatinilyticus]
MKHMKTIFTLFALFIISASYAQWTDETNVNTLVAESEATDMQSIGTSAGSTYVISWKTVPAPTNFELRLQILDPDGNSTLGADGVLISDQIPMSTFTVQWNLALDEADNLYLSLTGTGAGNPAYVFKIDPDGNQLWGENGVNVGSGYSVTVLPLSAGGAIVSWLASSGAVMQKYDETGTALWADTQPIALSSGPTAPGNFFELANGEYIAVFHALIGGINSNLYAQRYDVDGNSVWTEATQISNKQTAFNRAYRGVQDGDVVYMGYFGVADNRFDSYLQRINADGTLPWGINGSDFDTSNTNFEMNTDIAFSEGADHIWSICTYSNTSQSEVGEFVQKFDKDSGARLLTDTAKIVFPIGEQKTHEGQLQLKNGTPLFLIEESALGEVPTSLHAVELDANGDFVNSEEPTTPIATFEASKSRVQFTKFVDGQSVAVFVEDKGDGVKMYAQNFGEVTLSVESFDKVKASILFNNPVTDVIHVKSESQITEISLYNMLGQKIMNVYFQELGEVRVPLSSLSSGQYIMNVTTAAGVVQGLRVLKQ